MAQFEIVERERRISDATLVIDLEKAATKGMTLPKPAQKMQKANEKKVNKKLAEIAQPEPKSKGKAAKQSQLGKSKNGLIPVRKTVLREGRVHQQTFWVKPKDLRNMSTSNAARFMDGMVRAQQYFKEVADRLAPHLDDGAKAIYEKMQETGMSMIKVGKLQMKIADYQKQDAVSGDRLLAAIHSRPEAEIPEKIKDAISKLYKSVTTTTFGKNVNITGVASTSIGVERDKAPHKWTAEKWSDKFKDIMAKGVKEITNILSARKKGKTLAGEKAPDLKHTQKEQKAIDKKMTKKKPIAPVKKIKKAVMVENVMEKSKAGLVARVVQATRGGKSYNTTVYVRHNLRDHTDVQLKNMHDNLMSRLGPAIVIGDHTVGTRLAEVRAEMKRRKSTRTRSGKYYDDIGERGGTTKKQRVGKYSDEAGYRKSIIVEENNLGRRIRKAVVTAALICTPFFL